MSDEGEKTCPLCAEEMDLTDQQLKPCKCGYEICVWCWHHIMDMAEKDDTEGRCPACRSPYDKEKIVGMAAKCERYITYSKEDEAIRCIQNVHGFVLEGRSLRACFGTTKYCHAWLRNVPCTNPDCLYLHEIGSQEDSFTKDEIISAYTRSRVQQITGAANNVQRRAGNTLPPPVDDYSNNSSASSGKPIVKNGATNTGSMIRGSPRMEVLLDLLLFQLQLHGMGTRGSNCQPPVVNLTCSNGPSKQKPDILSSTMAFSSAVTGTTQVSILHSDGGKRPSLSEESQYMHAKVNPESLKTVKEVNLECQTNFSDKSAIVDGSSAAIKDSDRGITMASNISSTSDQDGQSCSSVHEVEQIVATEGRVQNLCSQISSMSIDRNNMDEHSGITRPSNSFSQHSSTKSPQNQGLQQYYAEQSREPSTVNQKTSTSINGVYMPRDTCDWISDSQSQAISNTSSELEEDVISFDNQRLKDPEVQRESYGGAAILNADRLYGDNKVREGSILSGSSVSVAPNGYLQNMVGSSAGSERTLENSFMHSDEATGKNIGRFLGDTANTETDAVVDRGESSIISNILSLDFDTWDDSLTSPQNLAKLLGDNDKQSGSHKISSSWKAQINSQSRFSFARQEESMNQAFDVQPSHNAIGHFSKNPFSHDLAENRNLYSNKLGIGNGFLSSKFEESEIHASNHPAFSSNKLSELAPDCFLTLTVEQFQGLKFQLHQDFLCQAGHHRQDLHLMRGWTWLLTPSLSRNGLMSNGHWDGGWNEVQGGNTMGMAELLRNERLGFNKFYAAGGGYED
ncbi:hypothetical protein FNV43_RR03632 [Rhamnella rubrinervis]|uniref:RING-type domain-containing protein n=1 Tax=Rhamnella rubrinervis TaxID=2594499 RepID=A0A8K0HK88_9ROSA|nr:hypothetical protein FNV43_RR03632 [Rhamnella rubrinervis]